MAKNILVETQKYHVSVYEDKKLATILAKILMFVGDMDELYAKTKEYHE